MRWVVSRFIKTARSGKRDGRRIATSDADGDIGEGEKGEEEKLLRGEVGGVLTDEDALSLEPGGWVQLQSQALGGDKTQRSSNLPGGAEDGGGHGSI